MACTTGLTDAELVARCRDRGFTPGVADLPRLLQLWGDAPDRGVSRDVVKGLSRAGAAVARDLLDRFNEASGVERAMRLQVATAIAARESVPQLLAVTERGLVDAEPRVVRQAVRAVGKLAEALASQFESELIRIATEAATPERRAAVEALGRVGGESARGVLASMRAEDPDLARRVTQATTLLDRRLRRASAGFVVLDQRLPATTRVRLRCRRGLADAMLAQLRSLLGPAATFYPDGRTAVEFDWDGTLGALYQIRCALDVAVVFDLPRTAEPDPRVVVGLTAPPLVAALSAWTRGPVRFRLGWVEGGPQRARVWRVAAQLEAADAPLRNDSRSVAWSIEVDERAGVVRCRPKGADPRFAYRVADVPAASHPTVAAYLAWLAHPQPGQLVWDPFCGSAQELIECARLARGLDLVGTDLDPEAVTAGQANLQRADPETSSSALHLADACAFDPRGAHPRHDGVDLIVTNPPMGHRVVGEVPLNTLLERFVAHAAGTLAPGGRLVWLSPRPQVTATAAQRHGLHVIARPPVDLGGLAATPQTLTRPR